MWTFTKHAKDRAIERGISGQVIAEAIQTKGKAHREDSSKTVFHGPKQADGRHVFVVANVATKRIITLYWLG